MLNWKRIGKEWGKCEDCWLAYKSGVQHPHSLHCYKLGIPISSLKIPLEQFLKLLNDTPGKYGIFSLPLSLLSNGVIILYFNSENEMRDFAEKIKEYVKDVNWKERKFYDTFVNVEWIGGMNWRRGCPEYDRKFGDWRSWKNE